MNLDIEYLSEQIITEIIYINPSSLNVKSIDSILITLLKDKLGNKCHDIGYILNSDIKFINKSMGELIQQDNTTKILYNIRIKVWVINPIINSQLDCYIDNINKMGIIAYIKMKNVNKNYDGQNNLKNSPMIIIVPNDDKLDITRYSIGDKIKININASRIKFNSNKIQLIGKII